MGSGISGGRDRKVPQHVRRYPMMQPAYPDPLPDQQGSAEIVVLDRLRRAERPPLVPATRQLTQRSLQMRDNEPNNENMDPNVQTQPLDQGSISSMKSSATGFSTTNQPLTLLLVTPRKEEAMKSSIPFTPAGNEASVYKYYCPLCMEHWKAVLKSKCCGNYACLRCTMDYLGTRGLIAESVNDILGCPLLKTVNCPHCLSCGFDPILVTPNEDIRDYSYKPSVSISNNSGGGPSAPSSARTAHRNKFITTPVKVGDSFEELKRKMLPFQLAPINKPSPSAAARKSQSIGVSPCSSKRRQQSTNDYDSNNLPVSPATASSPNTLAAAVRPLSNDSPSSSGRMREVREMRDGIAVLSYAGERTSGSRGSAAAENDNEQEHDESGGDDEVLSTRLGLGMMGLCGRDGLISSLAASRSGSFIAIEREIGNEIATCSPAGDDGTIPKPERKPEGKEEEKEEEKVEEVAMMQRNNECRGVSGEELLNTTRVEVVAGQVALHSSGGAGGIGSRRSSCFRDGIAALIVLPAVAISTATNSSADTPISGSTGINTSTQPSAPAQHPSSSGDDDQHVQNDELDVNILPPEPLSCQQEHPSVAQLVQVSMIPHEPSSNDHDISACGDSATLGVSCFHEEEGEQKQRQQPEIGCLGDFLHSPVSPGGYYLGPTDMHYCVSRLGSPVAISHVSLGMVDDIFMQALANVSSAATQPIL